MKLKNYILFGCLSFVCCFGVNAQTSHKGQISYDKISIVRDSSILKISMDIDLTKLNLKSNASLVLTPEISKGTEVLVLESIEIAGKRQYLYKKRNGVEPLPIKRNKKEVQIVKYQQNIPFSKWMRDAQLSVTENSCGCLDELSGVNHTGITSIELPKEEFIPLYAYIQPVSVAKTQTGKIDLNLGFASGKSMLIPNYNSNQNELDKLRVFINQIKDNKLYILKSVIFHGYASPDGSYALNARLANERVNEVANYASRSINLPKTSIRTEYTAEDWDGVRKFVQESFLNDKYAILSIIDSNISPDNMEQRIRTQHATSYRYLFDNCFPLLRRTECIVDYEIRDLTVDECKELFRTQPAMLSLNELYRLAESYPEGSDEFNEVFDVAVRIFPEDAVANLNAANVAIMRKQWKDAEKYLAKSPNTPESLNAKGVYHAMTGNFTAATNFLQKAAAEGLSAAESNLRNLETIM